MKRGFLESSKPSFYFLDTGVSSFNVYSILECLKGQKLFITFLVVISFLETSQVVLFLSQNQLLYLLITCTKYILIT